MIQSRHALRNFAAAFAAVAGLGLCASTAWAGCSPANVNGRTPRPFSAEDSVVYAAGAGLTWERCSVGQHFNGGKCQGSAAKLDWAAAQQAATAAGHGWRLPTKTELAGLVLSYCSAPATDTVVFPETPGTWFWSSTIDGAQGAWFVDFEAGGGNGATLRTNTAAVRLVRSGH